MPTSSLTGALWSARADLLPPKAGVDLLSCTRRLSGSLCNIAPSQSAIPRAVRQTTVTESGVWAPLINGVGHGPCRPTPSLLAHRERIRGAVLRCGHDDAAVVLARCSAPDQVRPAAPTTPAADRSSACCSAGAGGLPRLLLLLS